MQGLLSAIIPVIVGGVLVNYLIQTWQVRNWLHQQRVLGYEKKHASMAALFSDISDTAGRRFARMHRLTDALTFDDAKKIEERLADYDKALQEWNEKLSGLFVRLTELLGQADSNRFEREVQREFFEAGTLIEKLTRTRLAGTKPTNKELSIVKKRLNTLHGLLIEFNVHFLSRLNDEYAMIYAGKVVPLTESTLEQFTNWQLFKALFDNRAYDQGVFCTPLHPPPPSVSGS